MKKCLTILISILFTVFLTGCANNQTADLNIDTDVNSDIQVTDSNGENYVNNDIQTEDSSVNNESLGDLQFELPPPVRSPLQDRIFVSDWSRYSLNGEALGGTMHLDWYRWVFNIGYMMIDGIYIDYIGSGSFRVWIDSFEFHGGTRPSIEANIRSFADDFGLTVDDFIRLHEQRNGMPIYESDEIILWAREIVDIPFVENYINENGKNAFEWSHRVTSAEIRAKLSDNVYEIWEQFPGYGVVQNGNVYSPEWIIQNIEQAVLYEDIPIEEVDRILMMAMEFSELVIEVELAVGGLISAMAVLESR